MRFYQLALPALLAAFVGAQEVDNDDIPNACQTTCAGLLALSQSCDQQTDGDNAFVQCFCTASNVSSVLPACASCVQSNRNNDDDNDDIDDNDVLQLQARCNNVGGSTSSSSSSSSSQSSASSSSSSSSLSLTSSSSLTTTSSGTFNPASSVSSLLTTTTTMPGAGARATNIGAAGLLLPLLAFL